MPAVPKPKYKKHRKAVNNPVPTINDTCRYHGTPYAQTHECFYGRGKRQLSIRYGMQVKLCNICHREVHDNPNSGKDLELKQEFQRKFEQEYSRELFMKVFSKNYLDIK